MSKEKITIVWFRQDLRLHDNPALYEACKHNNVYPIFILEENNSKYTHESLGGASKVWLHESLNKLNESLDEKINLFKGDAKEVFRHILEEFEIEAIYWNRRYEPSNIQTDKFIKKLIEEKSIECKTFNANLLFEPWTVLKADGTPYKVFTPFYRKGCANSIKPRDLINKPRSINAEKIKLKTNSKLKQYYKKNVESLELLPNVDWYTSMLKHWKIGEVAARKSLNNFIDNSIDNYKDDRNIPSIEGTSKLSPYLHFGEISPHQVYHELVSRGLIEGGLTGNNKGADHFLSEIGWREFSYYLLYHFPSLPRKNFQAKFDKFPWKKSKKNLKAWQKGLTGCPIVDAGMRELWQTGYMHNRVRMIVASFLVKNLLIHWHEGADWFWDCLFDADLANNSASWQWVAGSGADAAPYFRIFNAVTQGEKFDTEGEYVRKYVPEIKALPNKYIHKPFDAPAEVLKEANITLGKDYPQLIADLKESRENALAAFKGISG